MVKTTDWRIPSYTVETVMATAAQAIDWGLLALGVPDVWTLADGGKGTKVAVLDTGAPDHPDLIPAILEAKDFTGSRTGPMDVQGHGTHVAGIVGARNDENGVVGVAPECSIVCGKVLGDNGSGSGSQVAAGIRWAIDLHADVISMSLGGGEDGQIHAAVREAAQAGIVVVCASGNSGPGPNTIEWPGRWDEVICVGSINRERKVSRFSSRGPELDVVAPGEKVMSCYLNRGFAQLSGSSMSTPFVAGCVLLFLAACRKAGIAGTPLQLLGDAATGTAIDRPPSGPDPDSGYGIISPGNMLARVPVKPPTDMAFSSEDFTERGLAKVRALLGNLTGVSVHL